MADKWCNFNPLEWIEKSSSPLTSTLWRPRDDENIHMWLTFLLHHGPSSWETFFSPQGCAVELLGGTQQTLLLLDEFCLGRSVRPIVTLVNDVPSIFGRVSNSNPKVTYEDIALLLKKFKKFLGAYRKQGSSSKKSSLADAKVRWYKPTIEDYENLSYNCKKLGQFKVDFAHQEKESKEKKDNRIRRDKSVDKNKDRKG
nr:hypothetical protein Iba_chr11fCG10630 [Ipomoea batatas]